MIRFTFKLKLVKALEAYRNPVLRVLDNAGFIPQSNDEDDLIDWGYQNFPQYNWSGEHIKCKDGLTRILLWMIDPTQEKVVAGFIVQEYAV